MRYHNEELSGKINSKNFYKEKEYSSVPMHDDYCYQKWAEFTAPDDYENYVWNWLNYRAPMDLFRQDSPASHWIQIPTDVVKGLTPEARANLRQIFDKKTI